MAVTTLRDLYQAELEDLYDAEQQIINALPRLQAAASSEDLKGAFAKHLERTRLHVERLDLIFSRLGLTRQQTKSAGIEGLIREGEQRLQLSGDPNTRDAALIAAAQHVEHYEIAGYGCARTFARLIGDEAGAHLLQETLDEEGSADHELTRIAMAGINQAAGRGEHYEGPELSRLRYIDADDLDTARHSWVRHKIRNRAGEDLGKVDGVIVESSGRPYYLVVDSGGLFVGKRYLVPVGKVNLDRGNDALAVDLDKDTFKRYPEFHSSAFASMTDDEARRYEWRVARGDRPGGGAWDAERRIPVRRVRVLSPAGMARFGVVDAVGRRTRPSSGAVPGRHDRRVDGARWLYHHTSARSNETQSQLTQRAMLQAWGTLPQVCVTASSPPRAGVVGVADRDSHAVDVRTAAVRTNAARSSLQLGRTAARRNLPGFRSNSVDL